MKIAMTWELEVFTGEYPPYDLERTEFSNREEAVAAYRFARSAKCVWAGLIEWEDGCGLLIHCGGILTEPS